MSETNIRHAANMLVGYAGTCQMTNTLAWMEGLARHINAMLEQMQSDDRVVTWGIGLETISAAEMCDRIAKGIETP